MAKQRLESVQPDKVKLTGKGWSYGKGGAWTNKTGKVVGYSATEDSTMRSKPVKPMAPKRPVAKKK